MTQSPAGSITSLPSTKMIKLLSSSLPSSHQQQQQYLLEESFIEEVIDDDLIYYEEEIIEEDNGDDDNNSRKKVKFDDFDEMQYTLHLNDYTDSEVQQSWYKREDYDGMIASARIVALKEEERRNELLSSDGDDGDKDTSTPQKQQQQQQQQEQDLNQSFSTLVLSPQHFQQHHPHKSELDTRGLEAWSPSGAMSVRKLKEAAIEAVWDEQHRQWEVGVVDLEQLREEYQKVTLKAQKVAEERGFADQQVVDKIRQVEELETSKEVMMKRKRAKNIFVKGKNILGRSVKVLEESIKKEKKRRDSSSKKNVVEQPQQQHGRQSFKQVSFSARAKELEAALVLRQHEANLEALVGDGTLNTSSSLKDCDVSGLQHGITGVKDGPLGSSLSSIHESEEGMTIEQIGEKLKRLGVLNRHNNKQHQSGFATWEESLAAAGKL